MKICCKELEKLVKDRYLEEDNNTLVLPELYRGPYNSCESSYYHINYCPFCGSELRRINE